jgi:hypothetical protein
MYRIAYQEGQRALDDQQDELNRMRDRAVAFTAFVGAATAFLVGAGLTNVHRDGSFYALASIATVFSLGMIFLLSVLLNPFQRKLQDPSKGKYWNYRLSTKTLMEDWIERDVPPSSEGEFIRWLADLYDDMRVANEKLLGPLRFSYWGVVTSGVLQVVLWAALVWAKA